jgi:hypothetical protein
MPTAAVIFMRPFDLASIAEDIVHRGCLHYADFMQPPRDLRGPDALPIRHARVAVDDSVQEKQSVTHFGAPVMKDYRTRVGHQYGLFSVTFRRLVHDITPCIGISIGQRP